jgi:hypothetical protein
VIALLPRDADHGKRASGKAQGQKRGRGPGAPVNAVGDCPAGPAGDPPAPLRPTPHTTAMTTTAVTADSMSVS